MQVSLFMTESCTHQDEARALVDEAIAETASEAGVEVDLEVITVRTDEEAHDARILGSPTIRVDGHDIEYQDQEPEETHPGCRYYNTPGGWKPLPEKTLLVSAIRRVAAAG